MIAAQLILLILLPVPAVLPPAHRKLRLPRPKTVTFAVATGHFARFAV